jgi:hypothetical protein
VHIGSDEIWVPGENGRIYAAPSLIVHYVEEHNYLPPPPFIEAVLRPVPSGWKPERIARGLDVKADWR